MAPYESSSSSSESEEDSRRPPAAPERQRQRYTPRSRAHQGHRTFPPLSSPPSTPGGAQRRYNFGSPNPRRQGGFFGRSNYFAALEESNIGGLEGQALRYIREIRPVAGGQGHNFSFVPSNRFATLYPRSEDSSSSSSESGDEEEEDSSEDESEDEHEMITPSPQILPLGAMEAHRRRPAYSGSEADTDSTASHEGSDSEDDEDTSSEDETTPKCRPLIYSPEPTRRSRSLDIDSSTHGYRTPPPMANFSIQDITPHSQDEESESESDISVVRPSTYSEAESSPPRPSSGFSERAYNNTYPSPTPTPQNQEEDIALSTEFENLDCTREREEREHELWIKKQRELKRRKRMSGGSLHKRTLSMSIGSDTDDEDILPHNHHEGDAGCGMNGTGCGLGVGVGGSASNLRRLRRKTLEGNMHSLIFDDPPQRIVECEEPESEVEVPYSPARRIPDLNQQGIWTGALPYAMDVDV